MSDPKSFYNKLGIEKTASQTDIKKTLRNELLAGWKLAIKKTLA